MQVIFINLDVIKVYMRSVVQLILDSLTDSLQHLVFLFQNDHVPQFFVQIDPHMVQGNFLFQFRLHIDSRLLLINSR